MLIHAAYSDMLRHDRCGMSRPKVHRDMSRQKVHLDSCGMSRPKVHLDYTFD